jgi:hypothetical protein
MAPPTRPAPQKKNGLWAVFLAVSFFALVFWLVWAVGQLVEKVQEAYARWSQRRARAAKAGAARASEASAPESRRDAAARKKDE